MKKLTKNFIAFTLSEMMIVLLILSVISAATLPSITQRNEVKPSVISSRWSFDYKYNKGYFYKTGSNSDSTDVIVGFPNLESATAAQKTSLQNSNKNASLRLMRPNYILQKVQDNASSIAFFGKDGTYHGKIAADSTSNIAIGKDVIKDPLSRSGSRSIFIGYGAAKGAFLSSVANLNIVVGHNAAGANNNYSILGSNNIVLGAHTRDLTLDDRNIIIGSYAANTSFKPPYSLDLVAIGSYAFSYNEYASTSTVGIGYWTGANSLGYSNNNIFLGSYAGYGVKNISTNSLIDIGYKAGAKSTRVQTYGNATNIGAFASYDSIAPSTSIGYYANYANSDKGSDLSINIGTYAGAKFHDYSLDHIINIGAFAGYASDSNGDLNIGYYAGSNVIGQPYPNIRIGSFAGADSDDQHSTGYTVMIGNYAGYGMDDTPQSLLIGRYAGYNAYIGSSEVLVVGCYGLTDIRGAKKMCIGRVYPGDKGGFAKTGNTVSTMITPYYSSSTWTSTGIYLMAKYVASFGGTLTSFSDKTLKENVVKTKYGIDKIRQVNIYQYNFKGEKDAKIGVIAQDLQKVFPEAVSKAPNNYLTVNSDWIIYSMVQALKDVDNAVNNLQKELSTNINLIKKLSVRLCSAEGKLDRLSQNNKDNKKQLAEIDLILSKMERK